MRPFGSRLIVLTPLNTCDSSSVRREGQTSPSNPTFLQNYPLFSTCRHFSTAKAIRKGNLVFSAGGERKNAYINPEVTSEG